MGAYVAKAETPASEPDVPPGWDPDWPFPPPGDTTPTRPGGPMPPGYAPVYSLPMTLADEVIFSDDSISPSVTLYDHGTYRTAPFTGNEPIPRIIWSATILDPEEESIDVLSMRFEGNTEYDNTLTSNYTLSGGFHGANPDIEFELDTDDVGKVITLTVYSLTGGQQVGDSAEIIIGDSTLSGVVKSYDGAARSSINVAMFPNGSGSAVQATTNGSGEYSAKFLFTNGSSGSRVFVTGPGEIERNSGGEMPDINAPDDYIAEDVYLRANVNCIIQCIANTGAGSAFWGEVFSTLFGGSGESNGGWRIISNINRIYEINDGLLYLPAAETTGDPPNPGGSWNGDTVTISLDGYLDGNEIWPQGLFGEHGNNQMKLNFNERGVGPPPPYADFDCSIALYRDGILKQSDSISINTEQFSTPWFRFNKNSIEIL